MRRNQPSFSFSDIEAIASGQTLVPKKEKGAEKSVPPARAPLLRSQTPRKRKADEQAETVDLELFDQLGHSEIATKLRSIQGVALSRMAEEFKQSEGKVEELSKEVRDMRKLAEGKNKYMLKIEAERDELKKSLEEADAARESAVAQAHEDGKLAAALALVQANLKIAQELAEKGYDKETWEARVTSWENVKKELEAQSGGEGSKQAEEEEGVEVPVGDDGKNEKA